MWKDKKVLVTGGKGFIGSHLVNELKSKGAIITIADIGGMGACDLRYFKNCLEITQGQDIVFNLAANVGGIGYNSTHQGRMFVENVNIGLNVMEASRLNEVKKYLCVSSACVYSDDSPLPSSELYGFMGDPQQTNFGYGWAKRVLELQSNIYFDESHFPVVIVRPFNCYGENDHFGINSHVIPSLIEKINWGKDFEVWGTGNQTRSFIYVKDLVQGMILAMEKGVVGETYNLGSTEEISIRNLVELLIKLMGKNIKATFTGELGGQPRRIPYVYKATNNLGFTTTTPLETGLKNTIEWYKNILLSTEGF